MTTRSKAFILVTVFIALSIASDTFYHYGMICDDTSISKSECSCDAEIHSHGSIVEGEGHNHDEHGDSHNHCPLSVSSCPISQALIPSCSTLNFSFDLPEVSSVPTFFRPLEYFVPTLFDSPPSYAVTILRTIVFQN